MKLTSPDFQNYNLIPKKFSCDGLGISPTLIISDVPSGTKHLVLIVDDPDAPCGDYVHWLVWNITPETSVIKENTVPSEACLGLNSGGGTEWVSPCPPSGQHRYFFKLYAINARLNHNLTCNKQNLLKQISGHIIEQTELVGLYERS